MREEIRHALHSVCSGNKSRFDALTRFVEPQLEQILPQVFETEYQPLVAQRDLVDFDQSLAAWAESWTRRWMDDTGRAAVGSTMQTAIPRIDVVQTKESQNTAIITASYGWDVMEMERASANGIGLSPLKQRAAVDAINREIDEIALMGNSELGYTGLLNSASVTEAATPPGGAWSGLTNQELVDSLLSIELAVYNGSKGLRPPSHMAVGPTGFARLHATYSAQNGSTVLDEFLKASVWVKNIFQVYEAETAGVGGTPSLTCYAKDPSVVNFKVGTLARPLAPQAKGFLFEVPIYAVVGGIEFARPACALRYRGV